MQPEPMCNEFFVAILILLLLFSSAIIALLMGIVKALSKRKPTVDDPTGEKKQKIFDSLNQAIEDIKSTV